MTSCSKCGGATMPWRMAGGYLVATCWACGHVQLEIPDEKKSNIPGGGRQGLTPSSDSSGG